MDSKLIDYDYIENAFHEVVENLERTTDGQQFWNELIKLSRSVPGFKAFIVLGGSYQERMMTLKSDLDFWVMLHGEQEFKIPKKKINRLFKNGIVNSVFEIIQRKYPNIKPCGASVRVFREFTEGILNKPKEMRIKRISSGLKIITFGKVVDVNRKLFGGKSEYVELRRKFKQFWESHNTDIWDVWGDLTEKLNQALRNLRRYKGKSLYRILQLATQQISDAYGFPEKYDDTLSLQEKLVTWTGRPRFTRRKMKKLGQIIEKIRISNLRVSELSENDYNSLRTQLTFFIENLYKPFRKWFRVIASMLSIFERKDVAINYYGISKTHSYIIFSSKNEFLPIKGVDLESSNTTISFLANLGRTEKTIGDLLEKNGFKIFHEEKDVEDEITHRPGFKGRSRIHVLLGDYNKNDILNESDSVGSDLLNKLRRLKNFLTST